MPTSNEQVIRIQIGGCGCGCDQIDEVPEEDLCLPADPPNDPQPNISHKCNIAHFVAVNLRYFLMRLSSNPPTYDAFRTEWVNRWNVSPTTPTTPNWGNYQLLMAYLRGADIPGQWDMVHNNYVCALYLAGSPGAALAATRSHTAANLTYFVNLAARILASHIDFGILFDSLTQLPPGYDGRSCCGQTPPPEPEPGGNPPDPPAAGEEYMYLIIESHIDHMDNMVQVNATGSVVGNSWQLTPTGTENFHRVELNIDTELIFSSINPEPEFEIAGLVGAIARTTSVAQNENDQLRISSYTGGATGWLVANVADGRWLLWHGNEYSPPPLGDGTPEFRDWVDANFAGSHLLTAVPTTLDNGKASFHLVSFGTLPNSASIAVDVWWVVRLNVI